MPGKHKGVHLKLSELAGHKIPFIPYQAHRLNTYLEYNCEASVINRNMINILENVSYTF